MKATAQKASKSKQEYDELTIKLAAEAVYSAVMKTPGLARTSRHEVECILETSGIQLDGKLLSIALSRLGSRGIDADVNCCCSNSDIKKSAFVDGTPHHEKTHIARQARSLHAAASLIELFCHDGKQHRLSGDFDLGSTAEQLRLAAQAIITDGEDCGCSNDYGFPGDFRDIRDDLFGAGRLLANVTKQESRLNPDILSSVERASLKAMDARRSTEELMSHGAISPYEVAE